MGAWIEMNFPNEAPESTVKPPGLLEGLGVSVKYVGKNRMDYLVEVESEEIVKAMKLKNTFTAYQASARGGVLKVRVTDERVYLEGQAVTVFQADFK